MSPFAMQRGMPYASVHERTRSSKRPPDQREMIMSTKAIDTALDFMPSERVVRRPRGMLDALRTFFASVRQGIDAAHHYERLTTRGVPPQEAVQIVFQNHFSDRR